MPLLQTGALRKAPDETLVQAVALGYEWFEKIKGDEVRSVSGLAEYQGPNQGDLSRVARLGIPSPGVVEAVLGAGSRAN